ncbi:MAG TPA: histidine phosphatase family protein [Alphaproteobacteria bacterium]|nr:histidine phosphatase family protein [Alphaproteobacteria bacterium]HBA42775.1 histidine phosphatase family protein [Alphaproteobacteria bacterium]HBF98486.1 histidine phosphatase family protein [Alphaproteobacteria bacterium]
MTLLAFIRHGRTGWNAEKRIQGRTDIPLSDAGRAELRGFRAPAITRDTDWHVSPLTRAVETARLIGPDLFRIEPRLIEMGWGDWEGETLLSLRDRYGAQMLANEARGRDFCPPGGESPRDVLRRMHDWFCAVGAAGRPVTALCHKGVIRAVLSHAYDWDMTGPAPVQLDWNAAHIFEVDAQGRLRPVEMNHPFEAV